jgi:hypothetical protein
VLTALQAILLKLFQMLDLLELAAVEGMTGVDGMPHLCLSHGKHESCGPCNFTDGQRSPPRNSYIICSQHMAVPFGPELRVATHAWIQPQIHGG